MKNYRVYIDRKGRLVKTRRISIKKVVITAIIFVAMFITVVYGSIIVNNAKKESKLSKVEDNNPKAFSEQTANYTNIEMQNTIESLEESNTNVDNTNAVATIDNNTVANIVQKNSTNSITNTIKDNSIANKVLPKTGERESIIPFVCILIILVINIAYIRYKK